MCIQQKNQIRKKKKRRTHVYISLGTEYGVWTMEHVILSPFNFDCANLSVII